jgi:hypothetical protein
VPVFLFFWNLVYGVTASYVFIHPPALSAQSFFCSHEYTNWWSLADTQGLGMDCSVKSYVDEMLVFFSVM